MPLKMQPYNVNTVSILMFSKKVSKNHVTETSRLIRIMNYLENTVY